MTISSALNRARFLLELKNRRSFVRIEDYPYTDFKGQTTEECKSKEIQATGKSPAAYLNYPKVVNSVNDRSDFNERKERLMAAVAQQPVIATLRSECPLLANYKKGVLTHDRGCEVR